MVIFFNDVRVRALLLSGGYVYTLRPLRKTGKDIAVQGSRFDFKTLGDVTVEYVMPITDVSQLLPYLQYSGLSDVNQWFMLAKGFYKYGVLLHLYRVRLLRRRVI